MTDKTDEFTPVEGAPAMTPEEIAATSPPVEEPLVLDTPVSDAGGVGGSDPASDPPATESEPAQEPEKTPQTVPLATHIEERKALQARIDETNAAHEARIQALLERFSPAAPAQEEAAANPMPDPITEPEQFERWLADRDARNAEALQAQRDEMMRTHHHSMAQQQEASFKAANPHYEAALNHFVKARAEEARLTYPHLTDEQILQGVQSELIGMAETSVSNGGNAAETIYTLAKGRGFVEPPEDAPKTEDAPKEEASAVDQVNKASAAARSVGAASGGGSGRLTAAAIANMSVEELAALDDAAFQGAMS